MTQAEREDVMREFNAELDSERVADVPNCLHCKLAGVPGQWKNP